VITEAWMRLQDRPTFRASATARFSLFGAGVDAARAIAQSGLNPANCRLLDPLEAQLTGTDDAGDTLGAWGTRLVKEMFKSHEQDFPVWEHMTYISHPPYARMEGCHKRLRRWAETFYA
jgi:hypothetical protein